MILASLGLLAFASACSGNPLPKPITGSIRVESSEPGSLDPARVDDPDEVMIERTLFKGLVDYDPKTGALRPASALSWTVSGDARVFTFTLRKNNRFSNGEAVTADSFVRAFNRVASKAMDSPLGAQLSGVLGFADYRAAKASSLAGVQSLDKYRLQITLTGADSEFVTRLGQPVFSPIPSDAAMTSRKPSFSESPIGNGPFMVDRWDHNEAITLKPNPQWYGVKPGLKDITFVLLSDLDLAYDQWKAGNLDWTRVPVSKLREAESQNPARLIKMPEGTVLYLVALTELAPTRSEIVRKAISLSIDRRTLSGQLFSGLNPPATGLLPPGMPGYRDPGNGTGPCESCAYDPAKARGMIVDAKIPPSTVIRLAYPAGTGAEVWAPRVAAEINRNLGLRTELVPKRPLSDYRAFLAGSTSGLLGASTITMSYPTPENFLRPLFGTGGEANVSRWSNLTFEQYADEARKETAAAARLALYRDAEDVVLEVLPVIPLWWQGELRLVNVPRYDRLSMDPFGFPTLETASPKKEPTR